MLLKRSTGKLAFCAVVVALTEGFLLLSGLAPWKLGMCAIACALGAAAVLSCGKPWALLAWIAAGILALLILPSKSVAILYCLIGHYPVCKSLFEQFKSRALEWTCKLALFYGILFAVYFGLRELFAELFKPPFGLTILVFVLGGAAFVVFDWALSWLIGFYWQRVGKHLHIEP